MPRLPLPSRDEDYRLALRLVEQSPPFDRQIVEQLVGRPSRYRDLRPLLRGRNDNVLNKALRRLRYNGIIKQGLDLESDERRYALTELGKLVVFRIHEMIPHRQSIEAYERGIRALEAQSRRTKARTGAAQSPRTLSGRATRS